MKQIILVTDGCSNVGMDPAAAAAQAKNEGIVVNVIGVVDHGEFGRLGTQEVQEIAESGGGMSRIVHPRDLSRTVQMVTRKTVMTTVQQVVQKEIRDVFGSDDIQDLPPAKRSKAVKVIDHLSEELHLKVALLIDTSASMKTKLKAVEDAIYDLMISLQAREGRSELAVFHFPGRSSQEAALDLGWTDQLGQLPSLLEKLSIKGATPTGPALMSVVQYFQRGYIGKQETPPTEEEGTFRDYII